MQQFRGIGRHNTDRQNVYTAVELIMQDDAIYIIGSTAQVRRKPLLGIVHQFRERGVAQIQVDAQDALAAERERLGKVAGDETLAASGVETGNHDDICRIFLLHKIVEFGAYQSERLVNEVAAVFADIDFALRVVLAVLPPMLLATKQRNLAEEGHLHKFKVLAAAHRAVEELTEEDDTAGDCQAEGKGNQQYRSTARRREPAAIRRLDNARVPRREGFGEFILLALLQEIDVKGFLHLLLTVDAKQLLCLTRCRSYLLVVKCFVGFGI